MSSDPIALFGVLIHRAVLEGRVTLPSDSPAALRFSLYNTVKRIRRLLKHTPAGKETLEAILADWAQVQVSLLEEPPGLAIIRLDRTAQASRLMEAMTKTAEGQAALEALAIQKEAEIDEALESQRKFLQGLGVAMETPKSVEVPKPVSERVSRYKKGE